MKLILIILIIINFYQTYSFRCGPSGVEIKDEWINDGYCDCPEENDENETGACSNESNPNEFLCKNNNLKRYQKTIPFSYFHDGACDCEDGSDEPKGRCENILPKLLNKELDERNKYKSNIYLFEIPKEIKEASMKNIDLDNPDRFKIIKWLKKEKI